MKANSQKQRCLAPPKLCGSASVYNVWSNVMSLSAPPPHCKILATLVDLYKSDLLIFLSSSVIFSIKFSEI